MSDRTLKLLVGALAVAVALWAVASLISGGGGGIGATGEAARFFDGIDSASIETIRMDGPTGAVELARTPEGWRVNGWEAGPRTVDRFLTALADAQVGDLAAANPANHARMGVSADSAVALEVRLPGGSRTLLVGDQGPRFGTAYGRLPERDEVYVIEGDLRGHVRRGVNEWRDTEILAVDTASVARVEVERDGDAYALVRGDSAWTFEGGDPVDPIQARNVLTELASIIAAGFLSEGDSIYALPLGGASTAYAADGRVLADVTVGSGEGERWVRAAGDSVVYRLSTFRVGRLVPTRETLAPGG
jgi:hypothetical protein